MPDWVTKSKPNVQKAAARRFKGRYAGPDKYKGVIPKHLKHKYKGKYFGKERYKGSADPGGKISLPVQPGRRVAPIKKRPRIGIPPGEVGGGIRKPINPTPITTPVQPGGEVAPKPPPDVTTPVQPGTGTAPIRTGPPDMRIPTPGGPGQVSPIRPKIGIPPGEGSFRKPIFKIGVPAFPGNRKKFRPKTPLTTPIRKPPPGGMGAY